MQYSIGTEVDLGIPVFRVCHRGEAATRGFKSKTIRYSSGLILEASKLVLGSIESQSETFSLLHELQGPPRGKRVKQTSKSRNDFCASSLWPPYRMRFTRYAVGHLLTSVRYRGPTKTLEGRSRWVHERRPDSLLEDTKQWNSICVRQCLDLWRIMHQPREGG